MAIDIGTAATNRGNYWQIQRYTAVAQENPANDTGTITGLEIWIWLADTNDTWPGTFSAAGNVLTCRDSESVGTVTVGSKQTFSGLDIDVVSGDYYGVHSKTGSYVYLEMDTSGAAGMWYYDGEVIDASDSQTFTLRSSRTLSLYGTGDEAAAGWAGTINTVASPAYAKLNGVAPADIVRVNSVA